ncbi:MAG TPA: AMP-binding protein, partial [Thermoanaerobaculia bacterium]
RLGGHLSVLLAAAAGDPSRALSGLPVLTPEEEAQIRAWTSGPASERFRPVHEEFAQRAAETPTAPALVTAGGTVTYAELNERAERLAAFLRGRGIAPEVVAALCIERSPELIASALAVLKTGGAFLPLDPAQPAERLIRMLADSGARVLVARGDVAARLAAAGVEAVEPHPPNPPLPSPPLPPGEGRLRPKKKEPTALVFLPLSRRLGGRWERGQGVRSPPREPARPAARPGAPARPRGAR